MSCEKHSADYKRLAEQVGDLRYDSLAEFLECLSDKLVKDSQADFDRNRPKLALSLMEVSVSIRQAKEEISEAWKISEPYMRKDNA